MSIIKVEIEHSWNIVSQIREKVRRELGDFAPDVIEASVMTASELVENGIKHGIPTKTCPQVRFFFESNDQEQTIHIRVTNGINSEDSSVQKLKEVIDKISASNDKAELYTQRLMDLMENASSGESQLGLYRIAYEGQFDLSYEPKGKTQTEDTISVIAQRKA